MRDTHRERQRHRQREKQAPREEPNAGLDPGTLRSCPEPKADAQPLSHPGVPGTFCLNVESGTILICLEIQGLINKRDL